MKNKNNKTEDRRAKPALNNRLALRALFAPSGSGKPQSGYALGAVFSPPHLGQGSMLRIALLPAPNVANLER